MLRIAATVGGQAHEVIWDDDGEVSGDEATLEMIDAANAARISVNITPTGPLAIVTIKDPRSVLAFMEEWTDHADFEGDMPPWPYGDDPKNAIY